MTNDNLGALRNWLGRLAVVALIPVAGVVVTALSVDALERAMAWRRRLGSWPSVPLEVVLPALAGLVLIGCTVWLALVTGAVVLETVTGRSIGCLRRITPEVLRRVVTAGLGVAVTGVGVIGPVSATPGPCGPPLVRTCADGLDGLPLPDRPVGGGVLTAAFPAQTQPIPARARPAPGSHVVEAGDSLWRIAAGRLPATATPAEVDAAWRRLYRVNRERIGADPDLLRVGLQLRVPPPAPIPSPGRPDGSGLEREKDES